MNELVSVIITTYKRTFEEISRSIHSVSEQTYPDIERILVDDNGIESEYQREIEIALHSQLRDVSITYIPNKINRGAQFSRNQGILAARGQFVAFLDDDDYWEKTKIEKQMAYFNDDAVGLVYSKGWTLWISDEGTKKVSYNMSEHFIEMLSFNDLSYGDYIGTTSQVLIKKEVFSVCGLFDFNQPARQDFEMWIRISEKYSCVGVPEYLFYHVQHPGEQISKNPTKAAVGIENIYRKYRGKMGMTAKSHITVMTGNAYKRAKKPAKYFKYLFFAGLYLIGAIIFDFSELKKRITLHNYRRNM